jgi:hypothetical protein
MNQISTFKLKVWANADLTFELSSCISTTDLI